MNIRIIESELSITLKNITATGLYPIILCSNEINNGKTGASLKEINLFSWLIIAPSTMKSIASAFM